MSLFKWRSDKKALAVAREAEELKAYYIFLKHYTEYLLSTEIEISNKLREFQESTGQNILEGVFTKNLWALRYYALHIWFLNLKEPKNQVEMEVSFTLVEKAFDKVLEDHGKAEYSSWLKSSLVDYLDDQPVEIYNLGNFRRMFPEKVAETITQTAFDSTEGRLGGELNDSVTELLMVTLQRDQKAFQLEENTDLSDEEARNIKTTMDSRQSPEKIFEEVLKSLE